MIVKQRDWCELITDFDINKNKEEEEEENERKESKQDNNNDNDNDDNNNNDIIIQISDFEIIDWEPVLEGKHIASSYIIRKGLSRKAQLAIQIQRYNSKHPTSILKTSVPFTLVVETWNAFEELKFDFGGGFYASFEQQTGGGGLFMQSSLRQRLEWALAPIQQEVELPERSDWIWILKPSVTNKGANITVHNNWNGIIDSIEDCTDVREWVLQRYIANPLTINGHKFHLRVYVLCVGALRVYVNQRILMLVAAHRYSTEDLEDSLAHLSNTARGIEDENFDEEKFVLLLDDLPKYLPITVNKTEILQNIKSSINEITSDLFAAYENEYTIFSPLENCFELFGLDFMIDENYRTWLLEVNPGPDFKQTGRRLKNVIRELWEGTCSIILDENESSQCYSLLKVYDKLWSVGTMKGNGMKLV